MIKKALILLIFLTAICTMGFTQSGQAPIIYDVSDDFSKEFREYFGKDPSDITGSGGIQYWVQYEDKQYLIALPEMKRTIPGAQIMRLLIDQEVDLYDITDIDQPIQLKSEKMEQYFYEMIREVIIFLKLIYQADTDAFIYRPSSLSAIQEDNAKSMVEWTQISRTAFNASEILRPLGLTQTALGLQYSLLSLLSIGSEAIHQVEYQSLLNSFEHIDEQIDTLMSSGQMEQLYEEYPLTKIGQAAGFLGTAISITQSTYNIGKQIYLYRVSRDLSTYLGIDFINHSSRYIKSSGKLSDLAKNIISSTKIAGEIVSILTTLVTTDTVDAQISGLRIAYNLEMLTHLLEIQNTLLEKLSPDPQSEAINTEHMAAYKQAKLLSAYIEWETYELIKAYGKPKGISLIHRRFYILEQYVLGGFQRKIDLDTLMSHIETNNRILTIPNQQYLPGKSLSYYQNAYTVTLKSQPEGYGAPTQTTQRLLGEPLTIIPKEEAGQRVSKIIIESDGEILQITIPVSGNMTITTVYEPTPIQALIEILTQPMGGYEYKRMNQGETLEIQAPEMAGYQFQRWEIEEENATTRTQNTPNLRLTISTDTRITAVYAIKSIEISDPNLEQAIREAEGYTGLATGPIRAQDVHTITSLYAINANISTLEGIEHLQSLTDLQLRENTISDLSPLQNLTQLEYLRLEKNQITDIRALSGLTRLKILNLSENQIQDIQALAGMSALKELNLVKNRIQDLTPLKNLTQLERLMLSYNELKNIEPLKNLTAIEHLNLWNNTISDIQTLEHLPALKEIGLGHNAITSLTPLVNNPQLGVGVSVDIRHNLLDTAEGKPDKRDIETLEGRGVQVIYEPQKAGGGDGETFPYAGEMVLVKGGTFQMGDEHGDLWYRCRPVHTVKLTYDYYIGKYEVTFNEYDAYCEDMGKSKPNDEGWGRGNRPVINVSWNDAIAYCNWLSESEGLSKAYDSSGNLLDKNGRQTTDITQVEGYRLPTEAEWEYAARGGHKSTRDYKYAGSNNLKEVGWYWQNSGDRILGGTDNDWDWDTIEANNSKTHEVGQKAPNELGLYDMSGNVWEWCHDWYDDYTSSTQTNPTGPSSASYRVRRGGSWNHDAEFCRVANRYRNSPGNSYDHLGLRIARTRD